MRSYDHLQDSLFNGETPEEKLYLKAIIWVYPTQLLLNTGCAKTAYTFNAAWVAPAVAAKHSAREQLEDSLRSCAQICFSKYSITKNQYYVWPTLALAGPQRRFSSCSDLHDHAPSPVASPRCRKTIWSINSPDCNITEGLNIQ